MEQTKKTALVTGGSNGIGQAIVNALTDGGFQVINADLVASEARGEDVIDVKADISMPRDREHILRVCRSRCKGLYLLVNNAGISVRERGGMLEATEEELDQLLAVNLKGPYFLTQQVAKWMIETKSAPNQLFRTKIVNIGSLTSYVSAAYMAAYGLSKACVSMMTKLYADRLSQHGINVYEIRPGIIKTSITAPSQNKYDDFIEGGGLPIKRWGLPEDVGKAVVAIAQDLLPYSTGEVINVDGGYHLRRL